MLLTLCTALLLANPSIFDPKPPSKTPPAAPCKLPDPEPLSPEDCEAERLDLFRKNHWVIFTNVEFLLWTVNESALDFAIKMQEPSWSSSQTYAAGKYKNATFGWDPGVRFSFGYFNAPHYWDIMAQYTFLHADGENTVHAPHETDQFLNGTWIGPDFNTTSAASPLQKAHSKIDLYYNIVDGLFSRRFHPNPHFRMSLFGGATAAFIHQIWHVRYTDKEQDLSKIKNKWSFDGAGARIGITLDWFIRQNFYFSGMISNAILSGVYKNHAFQNTNATVAGANNTLPFRDTHFRDVRLVYTAQFFLGPSWQKAFKKVRTDLFAGYEFTVWNNLHEIYRSSLAGPSAGKDTYINSSVMSLQGLTVRWNLDF